VYPADYGFIPGTLSEDGDPLDALVLIDEPAVPGCIVRVKPLGLLLLSDEHGKDPKVISTLPEIARHSKWSDLSDVTPRLLEEIEHFFKVYKDLEESRHVVTHGYVGLSEAISEIRASKERFVSAQGSGPGDE
jgi:inorganic pyrophosphatase